MYLKQANNLVKEKTGGQELQHYLRVLEIDETIDVYVNSELETLTVVIQDTPLNRTIVFNLTDGRPASEEDAKKFLELCGG